jgi:peptide/nickel transport system permease protein
MPLFLAWRTLRALVLVLVVSSAALLLVHLAPGDAVGEIGTDLKFAQAERARLGLDRPFFEQYTSWLSKTARLDFGESTHFRRPVVGLLAERVPRTLLLGFSALLVAIGLGMPLGVGVGSAPDRWWSSVIRAVSMVLVSVPPLIMSLVLLLIAARTGWLPAGGLGPAADASASILERATLTLRALILPSLAVALPLAAVVERLQSAAISDALREPCVRAALARGVPRRRAVWSHAFRLSLKPVLAVLGVVIGSILSGSFVVEIVMSWPGVGHLMYQALLSRDIYLAAGCAAAASVALAAGVLLADVALAAADPRTREAE